MTAALPLIGTSFIIELLIRSTFLIAGAWAAAAALRAAGASAAARHMAWLFGIAALLALPLVWWFVPAFSLPILPEAAASTAEAVPASVVASPTIAGSGLPLPGGWTGLVLLAYALVAAFLLLRIAVARRVLARLWGEAERAADPAWDDLLTALSLDMRLRRPAELRIARWPCMPMTWGTLAPRILLPAEAVTWSRERRRLVLLHELAHIARRDSLARSAASLACALYWFHPGAWFAARRMSMEQEHAADDRVLVAGGSAPAYARSLLHLATPAGDRLRPAFAASMAGMYQLERRLVSIVNPVRRDRPTAFFFASSALTALLATLAVAVAVPVSSPLAPSDPFHPDFAGTGPAAFAPDAGALNEDLEAGQRPAEAKASRDPVSDDPTERPGLRESSAGPAGTDPEARSARPSDPDASAAASSAPLIPPILAGGETFTLAPAAASAARPAALAPFRLASDDRSARSAPRLAGPRSFATPAPARARRSPSLLHPQLMLEVRGVPVDL